MNSYKMKHFTALHEANGLISLRKVDRCCYMQLHILVYVHDLKNAAQFKKCCLRLVPRFQTSCQSTSQKRNDSFFILLVDTTKGARSLRSVTWPNKKPSVSNSKSPPTDTANLLVSVLAIKNNTNLKSLPFQLLSCLQKIAQSFLSKTVHYTFVK